MAITYSSYLKVTDLLNLQKPLSNPVEHDEMLFIIIHQAYELWFKEILHEVDFLNSQLQKNRIGRANKTLKRINTIMKVLVHQIDILETMTPTEFLSFRKFLESASGFQSHQFRELEFALGAKNERAMLQFEDNDEVLKKLIFRFKSPSIWIEFLRYLSFNDFSIPQDIIDGDCTKSNQENEQVQNALIEIYRSHSRIADFCESLIDLDEGLQEWRYRHVKMVERTIGNKMGTGGSLGVEYLKRSLFKPVFPDLWTVRSAFDI